LDWKVLKLQAEVKSLKALSHAPEAARIVNSVWETPPIAGSRGNPTAFGANEYV